MDKLNAICIVAIFSGIIIAGISFGHIAFAQNTTTNTTQTVPQLVGQVTENTIVAWTGLLGVILTGVGFAIKVFHLDEKRYGKAITFTADGLAALYDQRKTLARMAELGTSETPEDFQTWLKNVAIPKANEWNKKAEEIRPKAEEAIALAAKFGHAVSTVNYGKKFNEGDSPD